MSLPIAWTDEAKETFDLTVNQIESRWRNNSAKKFVRDTNKTINLISNQPYMFKVSAIQNIRQAFISKQTSKYYEVNATQVTILFFWDNRQDPF